jgi:hypothetical protein
MESFKSKAVSVGIVAGITVVVLQFFVGPIIDLLFGAILIAIIVMVAKFAGSKKP